jgi:hypothetical protein
MTRLPLDREAKQRLMEDFAIAPGADGGVLGRGVEADYDQTATANR